MHVNDAEYDQKHAVTLPWFYLPYVYDTYFWGIISFILVGHPLVWLLTSFLTEQTFRTDLSYSLSPLIEAQTA